MRSQFATFSFHFIAVWIAARPSDILPVTCLTVTHVLIIYLSGTVTDEAGSNDSVTSWSLPSFLSLSPHPPFASSYLHRLWSWSGVKGQVGLKYQQLSVVFSGRADERSKSLSWETAWASKPSSVSLSFSASLHLFPWRWRAVTRNAERNCLVLCAFRIPWWVILARWNE